MKHWLYLVFSILLAGAFSSCSVSKVKSDSQPVQHHLWDSLLKKHVSPQGYVDYRGMIRDSVLLNKYLNLLSSAHPNDKNWNNEEQLAYWINAYNAFTIKLIVDHYPIQGIKEIKNGIPFVNTVWDIKFIEIENETYDLNNIEHGIIRAHFEEPRIHFAVNCASVSCPKLRNEAYTADKLDQQLDDQARYFINDSGKNRLSETPVKLSKIFSWFKGDFEVGGKDYKEFINRYASDKIDEMAEVEFLEYDWNLNVAENYR